MRALIVPIDFFVLFFLAERRRDAFCLIRRERA
jgi:hypothetical protein